MVSISLKSAPFVMEQDYREAGSPGNDRVDAPDITSGGDAGTWSRAQFINTIRSGTTPRGNLLNPRFMPWNRFTLMTDDELDAIWLHLQSLPAK